MIVAGDRICAQARIGVKPNPVDSARAVFAMALKAGAIDAGDVRFAVSTGYGREKIQETGLAQANVSEISCHGLGAFSAHPGVRTIIDIGPGRTPRRSAWGRRAS